MTESILLFIFAIVILLITVALRVAVAKNHIHPLTRRAEVAIRLGLCLLFAVLAHAIFSIAMGWVFVVAAVINAIFIYGCVHIADGLFLKKWEAPAR